MHVCRGGRGGEPGSHHGGDLRGVPRVGTGAPQAGAAGSLLPGAPALSVPLCMDTCPLEHGNQLPPPSSRLARLPVQGSPPPRVSACHLSGLVGIQAQVIMGLNRWPASRLESPHLSGATTAGPTGSTERGREDPRRWGTILVSGAQGRCEAGAGLPPRTLPTSLSLHLLAPDLPGLHCEGD